MQAVNEHAERPENSGHAESDLHAALHSVRYGILLLDRDLRAIFINRAFRQMWRLPDAVADANPHIMTLLEHGWSQGFYRVPEAEKESFLAGRMTQIERLDGSGQVDLDLQDGRTLRSESVTLPNGQRMITYMDITPLIEASRAAEGANRAKSDFLSGMSHELRTPLNAILGFAQLLQMPNIGSLTTRQQEFVDYILRGGTHLLRLIDDVLSFAKLDAGKLPIRIEVFAPQAVIADLEPIVNPLAHEAGINLHWPGTANLPLLRADRVRTAQALLNLLSNAIKYNRPMGQVWLHIQPNEGRLRFTVQDDGPGIPYERQAELFQPFNRLGREAGGIEGSGIGLALTRKLVESMGGQIDFDSRHGEGSQFWIELPLGRTAPTAAPTAGVAEQAENTIVLRGGFTLLYIEDHAPNRILMQHLMATLPNVNYHSAASGQAGLELAHRIRPDVILVDINLPDTDGYRVLQALRSDPETAAIPVAALTSEVHPDAIARGRQAGFELYFAKPIDFADFLSGLDRLLRRRKA